MEKTGMDAVLMKLGKKLGRKPMLKRKGLTNSEPLKAPSMTVVIGMGKPMGGRGAMAKRDDKGYPMEEHSGEEDQVEEKSPEGLNAKLDALMERVDALEARCDEYEKMGSEHEQEEEDMGNEEEED